MSARDDARWPRALAVLRSPVATLLTGSTVALALSFGLQPVLTRLYTPEAFGVANYFTALVGLLGVVATLRYDDAVMLPADDADAAVLARLSLLLVTTLALVLLAIVPFRHGLADMLGVPALAPWFWLLAPALLLNRGARIAESWLTRRRAFRDVSSGQVVTHLALNGSRIAAGLPAQSGGAGSLIGGFVFAYLAAVLYYVRRLPGAGSLWRGVGGGRTRALAGRYRRFTVYSTPAAVVNALLTRLPLLLLPLFFEERVLGFFAVAVNAVSLPLGLVGGAIGPVFFTRAAEARRHDRLPEVVRPVHAQLVLVGLFPALLLVVAGPDLFAFVFGPEWRTAGVYARWIGPWLFLASVAAPMTRVFDVLERQRADLATSLFMLVCLGAALVTGGLMGDASRAVAVLGVAGVVARVVHLAASLRLAGVGAREALRPYVRYAAPAAPLLAGVGLATLLHRPLWTTLAAAVAAAGYYLLVFRREGLPVATQSREQAP